MKNYVWKKRSEDWIKNNPGLPTMYKEYFESGVLSISEVKELPKEKIRHIEFKPNPKFERANYSLSGPDAGVYVILCENMKHAYVGQSKAMDNRMRQHKYSIVKDCVKGKVYELMHEHKLEHGAEAFTFIKHTKMPHASEKDLKIQEKKVMHMYIQDGYTLYNIDIAGNLYCDEAIRPFIMSVINAVSENSQLIEDIKKLIPSQK